MAVPDVLAGGIQLPGASPGFGGFLGYRIAIGSMFELHILLSGIVSGFTQFGPVVEWLGWMRRRPHLDRLAHGMGRFLIFYFAFGAASAIFLISSLLVGLWGHLWAIINRVLFWPFYVEAWTFFMMVILTYLWYFSWGLLGGRYKVLHMAMGGTLIIASYLQVAMIDAVASYMLTPTQPGNPIAVFMNPTNFPLQLHRTIANLAYAGYGIAGFAAFRYLRSRDEVQRGFWDWAGSFGVIWGTAMTLTQPAIGFDYAKEIQLHAYGAWYKMMLGNLSPEFLAQIFLLGLMLLLPTWYFLRRLRSSTGRRSRVLLGLLVLLAVTTVFATIPYQFAMTYDQVQAQGMARPLWEGGLIFPFAAMIPYKIAALTAYAVFALAAVFWYLHRLPEVRWGVAGRLEQWLLITSAVLAMGMIVLMGFIRENSRFPDGIAGVVQLHGQQTISQPSIGPSGQSRAQVPFP
jgi:cytochrome d ubiquinol oxidase subunit I